MQPRALFRSFSIAALATASLLPLAHGCAVDDKEEKVEDVQPEGSSSSSAALDTDGDGLTDAEEAVFGSDPNKPDTDEDGLNDKEEQDHGTNPNEADSDGDRYWDLWELNEGTDPLDPASVIYACGWPYAPEKDTLKTSGSAGNATANEPFARFTGTDQCGDDLDLFDFSGQGKPVVFDISGLWCSWCHELAKVMDGQPSQLDGSLASYGIDKDRLAAAIKNEEIYWVTIISQNATTGVATEDDLQTWYAQHPNDRVALMLDKIGIAADYVGTTAWPTVVSMQGDMVCNDMAGVDYLQIVANVLASLDN
ncbi:MAG: hypothetical protein V3V08_20735 [Nannocystaceae bacterium]